MYVFVSGRCEWMRELGLGFTNPLGTGGVLDMCLWFGCGGVGGVGGEWVGGLDKGRVNSRATHSKLIPTPPSKN